MVGFRFRESMSGTYRKMDAGDGSERPFSFTVEARSPELRQFLRTQTVALSGTVTAEGLAAGAPLEGTLEIAALTKGYLAYEFAFTGDDGRRYRFDGRKNLKLGDLLGTSTTLPGAISGPDGAEVARAVVRFDVRSGLAPMLASFRVGPV